MRPGFLLKPLQWGIHNQLRRCKILCWQHVSRRCRCQNTILGTPKKIQKSDLSLWLSRIWPNFFWGGAINLHGPSGCTHDIHRHVAKTCVYIIHTPCLYVYIYICICISISKTMYLCTLLHTYLHYIYIYIYVYSCNYTHKVTYIHLHMDNVPTYLPACLPTYLPSYVAT